MKHILFILAMFAILSCKAQSVVKPMGSGDFCRSNPDCYEKDVNNEFGKFEGTWLYQNGSSSITLKLKKEEHYRISAADYYEDLLVGEYQFIDDGVEVVNTLTDFNNPIISGYEHKISGGVFVYTPPEYCIDNSDISEIKIRVFIEHPTDDLIEGEIILRYVNDNGIEKLEACIYDYSTMAQNEGDRIDIPDGFYEFIKQD